MKIQAGENWVKIKEKDYYDFSIFNTDFMKCEGAYVAESYGEDVVVTYYNYGKGDETVFDEIKASLLSNKQENRLVDGDPTDPDYEDTSLISCIFEDKIKIKNYNCYGVLSKVLSPDGDGERPYVFQLYIIADGNVHSVQFRFINLDENNIEKSLNENELFLQVINSIQ